MTQRREAVGGVRVAVDRNEHAFILGHAAVDVVEIEAVGVRIELERDAAGYPPPVVHAGEGAAVASS